MQVNRMLDALGLPDTMGDMIGAQIDASRGDWAGYARNMMDLTGGMSSGALDKLFGKGLPGPHFAGRPHSMLGKGRKLWGQQFHTPFGTHDISREKLGGKGLFGRIAGRSMERNLLTNPAFKARMERILGGRIIPDGRADGKITVHRFRPNFGPVPFSNQIANNPMLSGIYGGLARMQGNIENVMKGMLNDPMGAGRSSATSGAGGAGGAAKSGGSGTASDVLKDKEMGEMANEMGMSPPMSFEDLLFLLMLKYAKKKEKEIMEQAKKLTRSGEGGDKAGGADGRRGFGGGLLGGIGKIAGTAFGGPIGGMVGGMVGNAVGGAIGGGGGAGGAAGGGGAGGAKGGYDPLDPNQSDTTKQAMLQKMMQDLQKVYQLLTNMMKSMHDMSMASVRNIR